MTQPVRLIAGSIEAAANPAVGRAIDGALDGPLPEVVGRSLGEHRVVERIVSETLANMDLDRAIVSAVESERTIQLLRALLASPALPRLLREALESEIGVDLTDRLLRSPEFERLLGHVLASPQVREALTQQSTSLAAEGAAAARRRAARFDARAERAPRGWLGRSRPHETGSGHLSPVPFAGVGTRGIALATDAAVVALLFLTGAAFVGLVSSLVGHLRPVWLAAAVGASAWLVLQAIYFVGFWTVAGQTPGMRLMRLRVQDRTSRPPGLARSLARLVGLALAIIPCFAGFLPVLVDDRRRALQDFVAGTVVIYEP
jgi:uncharacterized RDD family membrane protein YckC